MITGTGAQPQAQRQEAPGTPAQRRPLALEDSSRLASLLDRRSTDRRAAQRRGDGGEPAGAVHLDTRALCHDLRQPLATASVLAQLLAREAGLSGVGQERLALLQSELGRLAAMVSGHLDTPRSELLDLARLAHDVLRPRDVEAPEHVELVEEHPALVMGDPVLLSRMLANLVANARAAAGSCGQVRVTVGQLDEQACVVVEDSGAADEPSALGHGLGLLIVDTVAARHGGSVRCRQSSLGGLQMTVLLPGVAGWEAGDRS